MGGCQITERWWAVLAVWSIPSDLASLAPTETAIAKRYTRYRQQPEQHFAACAANFRSKSQWRLIGCARVSTLAMRKSYSQPGFGSCSRFPVGPQGLVSISPRFQPTCPLPTSATYRTISP